MAWGRRTRARVRLCGGALALAVLATGCWGEGGDADGTDDPSASPEASGGAAAAEPDGPFLGFVPDPDRRPKNRAQALKVARKVVAKPEDWGAGYVKSSDYKSGPRRTPELSEDCVWEQRRLPDSEFAAVVRRSELPAKGDAGPMRVAAVVTVHRTEESARWEMARTLEEPLRCPGQRLNATERVTGLRSGGDLSPDPSGATDYLQESGEVHSDLPGSPHPYVWDVCRMGTVTLAVSVKSATGHDKQEALATSSKVIGYMGARVIMEMGVRK
ncbi:hypothetical protein [Streptomyces sp. AC512_CC834]|uniref:hypothetical protein n=1 Tax=Streptomyces sp. AC512_CC834 TaxID=2823691 RepID=UPI001C263E03|nr:hypothetical protein [Streptomyces sp. AC512_CC834]